MSFSPEQRTSAETEALREIAAFPLVGAEHMQRWHPTAAG